MPTIEISDRAYEFLKGRAEPFVDTPSEVLDRMIDRLMEAETSENAEQPAADSGDVRRLGSLYALPSGATLTFVHAEIAPTGEKITSLPALLEILVDKADGSEAEYMLDQLGLRPSESFYYDDEDLLTSDPEAEVWPFDLREALEKVEQLLEQLPLRITCEIIVEEDYEEEVYRATLVLGA